MISPATAPPQGLNPANRAVGPGPALDAGHFAKTGLAFPSRDRHAGQKMGITRALQTLLASLIMGLSPGAALLLAGAGSTIASKPVAPLAQCNSSGPLVSSASGEHLACNGCVSHGATGAHRSTGMT